MHIDQDTDRLEENPRLGYSAADVLPRPLLSGLAYFQRSLTSQYAGFCLSDLVKNKTYFGNFLKLFHSFDTETKLTSSEIIYRKPFFQWTFKFTDKVIMITSRFNGKAGNICYFFHPSCIRIPVSRLSFNYFSLPTSLSPCHPHIQALDLPFGVYYWNNIPVSPLFSISLATNPVKARVMSDVHPDDTVLTHLPDSHLILPPEASFPSSCSQLSAALVSTQNPAIIIQLHCSQNTTQIPSWISRPSTIWSCLHLLCS